MSSDTCPFKMSRSVAKQFCPGNIVSREQLKSETTPAPISPTVFLSSSKSLNRSPLPWH